VLVPKDNFYRRLKTILDLHWLYKATKKYYGTEGQQSIDPIVFFKLMLIGYLENLGSDRRIINKVSMRLDMLFFVGYDINEHPNEGAFLHSLASLRPSEATRITIYDS